MLVCACVYVECESFCMCVGVYVCVGVRVCMWSVNDSVCGYGCVCVCWCVRGSIGVCVGVCVGVCGMAELKTLHTEQKNGSF